MEIIPYNSNYTLFYQVFLSPSFFPEISKIVQNYSTDLIFANSEQGQQFLSLSERWRNQITSDNDEGRDFLNIIRPTGQRIITEWAWVPMPGSLLEDKVGGCSSYQEICCLGGYMRVGISNGKDSTEDPAQKFIQHSLNFCNHEDKCNVCQAKCLTSMLSSNPCL